ncbi:MAG: hypothetical protein C4297_03440 [Gemmataceae bacterium]
MRAYCMKLAILFALQGLFSPSLLAQQKASSPGRLVPADDGKSFLHKPSKSVFTPPAGWKTGSPEVSGDIDYLSVRKVIDVQNGKTIEVTISWSPMPLALDEFAKIEQDVLSKLYGEKEEKQDGTTRKVPVVKEREPVKAGDRNGFRIRIDDDPDRNRPDAGVIYLFEVGSGKDRYKLRIRATFPARDRNEFEKQTEALLQAFKF